MLKAFLWAHKKCMFIRRVWCRPRCRETVRGKPYIYVKAERPERVFPRLSLTRVDCGTNARRHKQTKCLPKRSFGISKEILIQTFLVDVVVIAAKHLEKTTIPFGSYSFALVSSALFAFPLCVISPSQIQTNFCSVVIRVSFRSGILVTHEMIKPIMCRSQRMRHIRWITFSASAPLIRKPIKKNSK